MATELLMAAARPRPTACEFETATPPLTAPEYAFETALPRAVAVEVADPPLLATETAVALAANAETEPIRDAIANACIAFLIVSLLSTMGYTHQIPAIAGWKAHQHSLHQHRQLIK
jgi:hypothetical protein